VRGAGICGVLLSMVAPACGGSSSTPTSDGGGSGGRGGSGNVGGSGGARAGGSGSAGRAATSGGAGAGGNATMMEPVSCGAKACDAVVIPIQNFTIPACCADAASNHCGLDSSVLSMFGPTFTDACQPLAQPGTLDASCPDSPKAPVAGTALTIAFPGCCRQNRTCGYQLDSIGGIFPLGLGCVDSAPFLDGGSPAPCGDVGAGGAGGAAGDGSGGAPAAGAAGESSGGTAGDSAVAGAAGG